MSIDRLSTALLLCALPLAACSSLDGEPFEPGQMMRISAQTPTEISYEYALQWPNQLPRMAELAEQHCRANGGRSALEFHRWRGGLFTDFVTYRCVQRV